LTKSDVGDNTLFTLVFPSCGARGGSYQRKPINKKRDIGTRETRRKGMKGQKPPAGATSHLGLNGQGQESLSPSLRKKNKVLLFKEEGIGERSTMPHPGGRKREKGQQGGGEGKKNRQRLTKSRRLRK